MKILLSWLEEFVALSQSPDEIAKILTMAGLEVDAVEDLSAKCEQVVVCTVLKTEPHPSADRLKLAEVTDGEKTYRLVCGAANCRVGLKTALAVIGATVFDDDGKKSKIKKSKIRGVESEGMLCAPSELGLIGDSGIIELEETLKDGTDVASLFKDVLFEISLTPNLGHCFSILGVARELSALTSIPVNPVKIDFSVQKIENFPVKIQIDNPVDCPRYASCLIKGVKVQDSPEWLKKRLELSGIRPINHVVDATNYVMLELGHPLHAFDYDKLVQKEIIVRNAKRGEKIITLDEKERVLEEKDLLVCDGETPIALAGIMGGALTSVDHSTEIILLEAAFFSPTTIRKTAKRLGVMTDASKRFERGIDPNILNLALERALTLIQQISPEAVCSPVVTSCADFPKKQIKVRLNRINEILGTHLGVSEVEDIFNHLMMKSTVDGKDSFMVEIPTYRNDVNEEIDLIEEVARIYGYDHIDQGSKMFSPSKIPHTPAFLQEREIRQRLLREGLQELLTCDLIGPSILDIVGEIGMPSDMWVKVLNPNSAEQSILRPSLMPGLLQVVKHNQDHGHHDVAGFELGRVHFRERENYSEQLVAGIVLTGLSRPANWNKEASDWDFFSLKGILENLLNEMKVKDFEFKPGHLTAFHPGRQAAIYVGSTMLGMIGEVHPSIIRQMDISKRVLFAEINLADLFSVRLESQFMSPISMYPGSERDWTITLEEKIPIGDLFKAIEEAKIEFLESWSLIGIYRGNQVEAGLKNVTVNFVYKDKNKTISQEIVDREHTLLMEKVLNSRGLFQGLATK